MYHVTLLYPEHIANTYGETYHTTVYTATSADEAVRMAKADMIEAYIIGGGSRDNMPASDIVAVTVILGGEPQ